MNDMTCKPLAVATRCRLRAAARQAELAARKRDSKRELLRQQSDDLAARRARAAAQRAQQLVRGAGLALLLGQCTACVRLVLASPLQGRLDSVSL